MSSRNDAPVLRALHALSSESLLAFLGKQRWFAAKGASPANARVLDAVVVPWGNGDFAIARIAVDTSRGTQHFQLPFSSRNAANPDAVADDEFRAGMVDALWRGAAVEGDAVQWIAEPVSASDLAGVTRVGSAEQSNTSIIIGDRAIFKLFRLLKPGVHPDVEMTKFLTTRAGFTNTPRLLATTRFESDGNASVSGMMQEFLPGSSDAWVYALERGRPYFAAPRDKEPKNEFVVDARTLGATTRALHEALASDDDDPDFSPEPITPEDLDRWALRTQQSIRDALALLERQVASPTFPKERLAEAQALLRRRDHYIGWVNEIDDSLGDDVGMRIRIHGDYHLGQVLRAKSGEFMIIDFEGEPSKSIEERREKSSPLRDVAGMLRSFAYAAATLANEVGNKLDVATRELRVARWERDVRAAYLEGYLAGVDEDAAEILPESDAHVRQLISLFETEKAFYELAYELNNRPAWVGIPLRGISKLAVR
jgi:trehalose synthase-fused probable maltokinase